MTICESLLCKTLDSISLSTGKLALSDMNYLAGKEFRRPFSELEAHEALPIAREMADVWSEGVVADSVTLVAIARSKKLDKKIAKRNMVLIDTP